jgi:hypothetical protein
MCKVESPHLGNMAKSHSPASQCGEFSPFFEKTLYTFEPTTALIHRYKLQSHARELLPEERVSTCHRHVVPGRNVDLLRSAEREHGFFAGLKVCASVWICPVCAAKITERRRVELSSAVAAWRERGDISLTTLTLQHNSADRLRDMLNALKHAYKLFRGGKAWQQLLEQWGIVGSIRALEVTHGANGWHPHFHILNFHNRPLGRSWLALAGTFKGRWAHTISQAGRYASYEHGCDVRMSNEAIADYVAKFGREPMWTAAHEMTKSPTKGGYQGGRTPRQLLEDYARGDKEAGLLWRVYAIEIHGQRQLVWSRGLRKLLGLEPELSDEEIAEEQSDVAVILATLTPYQWKVVLGNDARGELAQVLTTGDAGAVLEFLEGLGVEFEGWQIPGYNGWDMRGNYGQ